MSLREPVRSRPPRAYAPLAVSLVVVAVVVSVRSDLSAGATTPAGVARLAASVLLLAVAAAVAHEVLAFRQAVRHHSIRAEIAAGGGLGKRLMV